MEKPTPITLESLTQSHPEYVLNSVLFRLAVAMGMEKDENNGIQVNVDDLIADVEDALRLWHQEFDGS